MTEEEMPKVNKLSTRRKNILKNIYKKVTRDKDVDQSAQQYKIRELEARWDISYKTIEDFEKDGLMPYRLYEHRRLWSGNEIREFETVVIPRILQNDEDGMAVERNRPYATAKLNRLKQEIEAAKELVDDYQEAIASFESMGRAVPAALHKEMERMEKIVEDWEAGREVDLRG